MNVVKEVIQENLFCGGDWEAFKDAVYQQAKERPECRNGDSSGLKRQLDAAKAQQEKAVRNLLMADPENVPTLNAAMNDLRQRVKALEREWTQASRQVEPKQLAEEVLSNARRLLDDLVSNDDDRLKAVLAALVEKIELNFEEGRWNKRKVRMVSGGAIYLRTTLTTPNRGDKTPVELFINGAVDAQGLVNAVAYKRTTI